MRKVRPSAITVIFHKECECRAGRVSYENETGWISPGAVEGKPHSVNGLNQFLEKDMWCYSALEREESEIATIFTWYLVRLPKPVR